METQLLILYSETISLFEKVDKLTENAGPAGFVATKQITVMQKITLAKATAHECYRITSSSLLSKPSSTPL